MASIRKILVKVLGLEGYLRLISRVYLTLMKLGFFKKKYDELHFISQIIKPSFTVLDIGANLGYYSYFMAKKLGTKGQLIAVEPIPLFANIWHKNLKAFKQKNIQLHNCALGDQAQSKVKMSIPIVNGVVRHGLTQINANNDTAHELSFEVPMHVGDHLIQSTNISKLDYLKCDVEGYEQYVIPSLKMCISTHKPCIQIELNGKENRENVTNFLLAQGYAIHILDFNILKQISKEEIHTFNQDFYFIHPDKKGDFAHLIR